MTDISNDTTTTESNEDFVKRTSQTVGELRKTHGAHFAPGFQDTDKIGTVLANAGVNSVEDLLKLNQNR